MKTRQQAQPGLRHFAGGWHFTLALLENCSVNSMDLCRWARVLDVRWQKGRLASRGVLATLATEVTGPLDYVLIATREAREARAEAQNEHGSPSWRESEAMSFPNNDQLRRRALDVNVMLPHQS